MAIIIFTLYDLLRQCFDNVSRQICLADDIAELLPRVPSLI